MNAEGLVSIIVPCYNYGRFLSETLESVRKQSYKKWECIIIDDGSTDNTNAVANRFIGADDRFKYFYQSNKGTSPAKNSGINRSKGEYFLFLDADDLIAEKKVEAHVDFLQHESDIGLVYSDVRYFASDKPSKMAINFDLTDTPWIPGVSGKNEDILKPLLHYNIMVISAPLIRRNVVETVGLFNEELRGCEDWEYWIRCALSGCYFKFDDREEVFTFIRIHADSAQKNRITMLEGEVKMRTLIQHTSSVPQHLKSINNNLLFKAQEAKAFKMIEMGALWQGYKSILSLILKTRELQYYTKNSLYWLKRYINQKSLLKIISL